MRSRIRWLHSAGARRGGGRGRDLRDSLASPSAYRRAVLVFSSSSPRKPSSPAHRRHRRHLGGPAVTVSDDPDTNDSSNKHTAEHFLAASAGLTIPRLLQRNAVEHGE